MHENRTFYNIGREHNQNQFLDNCSRNNNGYIIYTINNNTLITELCLHRTLTFLRQYIFVCHPLWCSCYLTFLDSYIFENFEDILVLHFILDILHWWHSVKRPKTRSAASFPDTKLLTRPPSHFFGDPRASIKSKG